MFNVLKHGLGKIGNSFTLTENERISICLEPHLEDHSELKMTKQNLKE